MQGESAFSIETPKIVVRRTRVLLFAATAFSLACSIDQAGPTQEANLADSTAGLSIRLGTYFGECLVDCNETITVRAETTTYTLTSNVQDSDRPDIRADVKTAADEWKELTALVNVDNLRALPDKFGEPDASDAGGEFVEVTSGDIQKRIDLDLASDPPEELRELISYLREFRGRLSAVHGRKD